MLPLLLLGCAPEPPADPCAPGPAPALEVGTGETAYAPLEPGGLVELIHGPQGGYHILIGLAARGLYIEDVVLGELTGTVDGVLLAEALPYLQLRCNTAEGAAQSWGTLLIFDSTPEALHDQVATVEARLTDS